jgi:hypothetical protein
MMALKIIIEDGCWNALHKCVNNSIDDLRQMLNRISLYESEIELDSDRIIDPIFLKVLLFAVNNNHDMKKVIHSISPTQLLSKYWLVEALADITQKNNLNIQILGGWFGFVLSHMLLERFGINYIQNIDIDERSIEIFNFYAAEKNYNFYAAEKNMQQFKYKIDDAAKSDKLDKEIDIIINTSSEHMSDLPQLIKNKKYKKNSIFALQSNNMFHIREKEGHINCCNNEEEFIKKASLSNILYRGTKYLPNGYERYMVIGKMD